MTEYIYSDTLSHLCRADFGGIVPGGVLSIYSIINVRSLENWYCVMRTFSIPNTL